MWKPQTKPPTLKQIRTLKAMRRQLEVVRSARKRCNEIVSAHKTVKSPRLDGMPRGNNLPCGLDGSSEQNEALLAVLKREEKKLKQLRAASQKIIDPMPPELYSFCMFYYLEGMSVQNTAKMIDRCEGSCWNYKAFIEQAIRSNMLEV